jgi:hypothetical protein
MSENQNARISLKRECEKKRVVTPTNRYREFRERGGSGATICSVDTAE